MNPSPSPDAPAVLTLGIPRETRDGELRVAGTPDTVKRLRKRGLRILVEKDAGTRAGYPDADFAAEGAEIVDARAAHGADIVCRVNRPSDAELGWLKRGATLVAFLEPFARDAALERLAATGVSAFAMELIPRTSRAQSMDALSSQANVAGYRAVLEAAARYGRFFPMMMTAAGSAKPARVIVLGAGVAGLQAIGTARRLGAAVEAYDIRPEVKEQIQSLGAKFIDIQVGEEGSGAGGYARELSADAKARQQAALTERLKKADVIISTANVPGRRAPTLVTEEAVRGMRAGSVIIDMAAANGGNCPLTEADRVVIKHGVTLVGLTNYPALMATDSSSFYARNAFNLLGLMIADGEGGRPALRIDLQDDIVDAALLARDGSLRPPKVPAPTTSAKAVAAPGPALN